MSTSTIIVLLLLTLSKHKEIESISFLKNVRKGIKNNTIKLKNRFPTAPLPLPLPKIFRRKRIKENEKEKEVEDNDNDDEDEIQPLLISYYLQQQNNKKKSNNNIKLSASCSLTGNKGSTNNGDVDIVTIENQINQDRSFILNPYYNNLLPTSNTVSNTVSRLLGTFDGHGEMGELVSSISMKLLPKLLLYKLPLLLGDRDSQHDQKEVKNAIIQTFLSIDDFILDIDTTISNNNKLTSSLPFLSLGGCSASIILQRGDLLYVANTGDSSSFIATYDIIHNDVNVIYISREDKPGLPDEKLRIESMGGTVYTGGGDSSTNADSRVLYKMKNTNYTAGLAMSRSIGDWDAKDVGVIADPIIDIVSLQDIQQENEKKKIFAISVTDGLLGVLSPYDIAKTIAQDLYHNQTDHDHKKKKDPMCIAEELVVKAAMKWDKLYNYEYRDDISISFCDISS